MIIKGQNVRMTTGQNNNGGHRFVVTEKNNVYPLIRPTVATTVRITLIDASGKILNSYNIDAMAGRSLTYCAPYLPGYFLAEGPSLGVVDKVSASGSSELVFIYSKIITEVTITAKENDANGRVLGVYKVNNPKIGMHRYPAPDLQADSYQAFTASVTICWDGVNAADGEAYYIKKDKV